MTPDKTPQRSSTDPAADAIKNRNDVAPDADDNQASDDPRGDDTVRRELGPGDGDDPPPVTGDEPSPR